MGLGLCTGPEQRKILDEYFPIKFDIEWDVTI
jgi:hypothetical protein